MRARCYKNKIVFSDIMNEALQETVLNPVEASGVTATKEDFGTKVTITGTPAQLTKYQELYNAQLS